MVTKEAELQGMRKELLTYLGREALVAIHQQSLPWDLFALEAAVFVFTGLFVAIATLPPGLLWAACIVLQGMMLAIMGLVNHDLFVHRQIFGDRGSWIASILLTLPLPFNPTEYAQSHLLHHRYIGTERDTEIYKQDISTPWRRLLFCTVVGLKRAMSGAWATPKRPPYLHLRTDSRKLHRRVAVENRLQTLVTLVLVVAAWPWPRAIIWGYFVPTLVLAPLLNTLRILIEHAEVNPDNPYHIATFYRTSWFTRLIYLWDSGDGHLVHHLYPTVPYYRIGKALALLRPFLLERGVIERRVYGTLLWGWFVKNYAHRSLWPIDSTPRLP